MYQQTQQNVFKNILGEKTILYFASVVYIQ